MSELHSQFGLPILEIMQVRNCLASKLFDFWAGRYLHVTAGIPDTIPQTYVIERKVGVFVVAFGNELVLALRSASSPWMDLQ